MIDYRQNGLRYNRNCEETGSTMGNASFWRWTMLRRTRSGLVFL